MILLAAAAFFSCSKDDSGSKEISYNNMVGKWNIKSIIKADNSVVNYVGSCPTQKDYLELLPTGDVIQNRYIEDCVTKTQTFCDDFALDADHVIHTSCSHLDEGEVVSISNTTLRIEYAEPTNIYFMNISVDNGKAILFEKRE